MLLPPHPYVPWPSHTSFIAYIFLKPVPPLDASSIAHTASCFEPLESLWLFSMPLFCPQWSITSQNVYLNHKPGSSTLHLKTLPWPCVFYKAYSELTTMAYKALWSHSLEALSSFMSSTLCSSGISYIKHTVSVLCALTQAVSSAWNVPLYLASPASSVRPNVGSSPGESLPGSLGWMSCFPPFSSPLCTSQSLRFTPLFIMTIMRKIIDCELFEGTDGNLFVHLVPNTVLGPWQMVNEWVSEIVRK